MPTNIRRAALAACALAASPMSTGPAAAQPATALTATCETLSAALESFQPGDDFVGIEVEGELVAVEFDGVVALMAICGPPVPLVLCVTYSPNEYHVGDRVILSGSYVPAEDGLIQLDPCLHYPPQAQDD